MSTALVAYLAARIVLVAAAPGESYTAPLDADAIEKAHASVLSELGGQTGSLPPGLLDALKVTLVAEPRGYGRSCPIEFVVRNPYDVDLWAVEFNVTQTRSGIEDKSVVTLPVVPAHNEAYVEVTCNSGYGELSVGYDSPLIGHHLDLSAGSLLEKNNTSTCTSSCKPGGTGGPMAAAALNVVKDPKRLAALAKALATQPAANDLLLDFVLNSRDAAAIAAVGPALRVQCSKSKARATEAYTAALNDGTGAARSAVLAACPPALKELQGMLADMDKDVLKGVAMGVSAKDLAVLVPTLLATDKGRAALRGVLDLDSDDAHYKVAHDALDGADVERVEFVVALADDAASDLADSRAGKAFAAALDKEVAGGKGNDALAAVLNGIGAGAVVDEAVIAKTKAALVALQASDAAAASAVVGKAVGALPVLKPAAVEAALKDGKLDAIAFLRDRSLVPCATMKDADGLVECARALDDKYRDFAAGGLSDDVVKRVTDVATSSIESFPKQGWDTLKATYVTWGVPLRPIADALCTRTRQERDNEYRYGDGELARFNGLLEWVDVDGAACRNEFASAERSAAIAAIAARALRVVVAPLPILGVFFWARRRFRGVIAPPLATTGKKEQKALPTPALLRLKASSSAALKETLGLVGRTLGDLKLPAADAAAAAVAVVAKGDNAAVVAKAGALCEEAVESGQLHSTLVRVPGLNVLVAAFPGRHDEPSLLRQHPGFAHGLAAHLERLRRSLAASNNNDPVLALLLFVLPDAKEGVVCAAYDDGTHKLLPLAVLAEGEEDGAAVVAEQFDLKLS